MANVIELKKPDNLVEEIDRLLELNKQGKVTNFVMVYTVHTPEDIDSEHGPNRFYNYWFGESTFLCLGMVARVMDVINGWIKGEVYGVED